jgi:hypothetical protein
MDGQESPPTRLLNLCWMVCQYSTPSPLSSEKNQGTPGTEVERRGGRLGCGERNGSDGQLLDSARVACGQQPIGEVNKITEIYDALEVIFI